MYFAILLGGNGQFLIVGFYYIAERDTFVSKTEFQKINLKQVRQYIRPRIEGLCRKHPKAVFDHNGTRIAYLHSLYKSAAEQMPR